MVSQTSKIRKCQDDGGSGDFHHYSTERGDRKQIAQVTAAARDIFQWNLWQKENSKALNYLRGRGLGDETIRMFGLGYALNGWDTLYKQLIHQDISPELILTAGLVSQKKDGGYIDRFRNRIIFPIIGDQGVVLGFNGRALGGDNPKYLNSPETVLFSKSSTLYGLHQSYGVFEAGEAIEMLDQAVILEGNFDICSLADSGILNAVSCQGTAFTGEQANLILPHTGNFCLALDNDEAGVKATHRAIATLKNYLQDGSVSLKIPELPADCKDPDEVIQKHGSAKLKELIATAPPYEQWQLSQATKNLDTSKNDDRIEAGKRIEKLIREALPEVQNYFVEQGAIILSNGQDSAIAMYRDSLAKSIETKIHSTPKQDGGAEQLEKEAAIADEFLATEREQESWVNKIFGVFGEFNRGGRAKARRVINRTPLPLGDVHEFNHGKRLATIQGAIAQGYKIILDKTPPGVGKTYDIAKFKPSDFGADKLFYVNTNHRNTTVPELKEWQDLTPRHNGLVEQTNPDGSIALRRIKKGEIPSVVGNCHKADQFAALANKNHSGLQESAFSPVCGACHLANACKHATGAGFGYRHERRSELQAVRLRAAPESLQPELVKNSILFFDDQAVSFSKNIEKVTARMIEETRGILAIEAPEIFTKIDPILRKLIKLLKGGHGKFGLGENQIREELPTPTDLDIEKITKIFTAKIEADLAELNPVAEYEVDFADLPRNLQRRFRDSGRDASEKLEAMLSNWLLPFLEALTRASNGTFRIDGGYLKITIPDNHDRDLIKSAKAVVISDATKHPQDLARELGVDVSEIFVIREKVAPLNNLKVVQITGVTGLKGSDRSDHCNQRLTALKTTLGELHTSLGVIDKLSHIAEGEGAWHRDNRGSNAFIKNDALLAIGEPIKNLGALAADYKILYGVYPDFQDADFVDFVDRHTQSEIIQAMHRLRAYQRYGEKLTFYVVTDMDLSFLDLPVEETPANRITPEAGTSQEQWTYKVKQAAIVLASQGMKLTQENLAGVMQCCQAQIVKISKLFGGWGGLKKLLHSLLEANNRNRNNFNPDFGWFGKNYLPGLEKDLKTPEFFANFDLEFFADLIKAEGDRAYEALATLNPTAKGRLLGLVLAGG